ncbi:B3/4 domain-containing protein [Nanoarchaeota archaeon]
MKFKIDSRIFEKFPDLNIGIVTAKGIDNKGINEEIINQIREKEKEIRANFSKETLSQDPKIDAWRKAYSSFKAKPKKYRCSVENLYRMILDGIELRHINKVVDIYNYISIKNMIPVGGDDTDKIDGNITLKFAQGDEPFVELNSKETKNPKEGEVIYADDKEVLCRRWNWRECDKSKMTEETKNVALVVEGLPPTTKEDVEKIIEELSVLVQKSFGGEIKTFILNNSNVEVEI